MKATHILLRWYKSFNISYLPYEDRNANRVSRPWNKLLSRGADREYRFIEIPLANAITTIVGANESGKSHLLSAISKVMTGRGIPDSRGRTSGFDITDLCHYASTADKNATTWPNLGLTFKCDSEEEIEAVNKSINKVAVSKDEPRFTLVLHENASQKAVVYAMNNEPIFIDSQKLETLRSTFPPVVFIRSNIALAGEVRIDDLIAGNEVAEEPMSQHFGFDIAQRAAAIVRDIRVNTNSKLTSGGDAISSFQQELDRGDLSACSDGLLEKQLFTGVMGIEMSTLKLLARTKPEQRGFAEGLIAQWNDELERALNLSRFWQQDDEFNLSIDYKDRTIYFEIRDKTGSTYTFRERSSGLKYFLSYYIQAKYLEEMYSDKGCIILMDEPDSFLSIAGQRNMLAVFEKLVSKASGNESTQLLYTTHSPFLINPNFPNRIRLVSKGEAEEGTQYVDQSRLRRYEPVRSALGINCAQTLFMGEMNIILEGPSDQFAIAELIRVFAMQSGQQLPLDLANIVLTSADSAPGVEKILQSSLWADEKIPATVVMFDNDEEGILQRQRITGKKKSKKVIEPEFVVTINDCVEWNGPGDLVTTEDLIPHVIYAAAIKNYLSTWFEAEYEANRGAIDDALSKKCFGDGGIAKSTKKLFNSHVFASPRNDFDKLGVLQEAVKVVNDRILAETVDQDLEVLKSRTIELCRVLRDRIESSKEVAVRKSSTQSIKRLINDFFRENKSGCEAYEMLILLKKITREATPVGDQASSLLHQLDTLTTEVEKLRESATGLISNETWQLWSARLISIKQSPLEPEILDLESFRARNKARNEEIAAVAKEAERQALQESDEKLAKDEENNVQEDIEEDVAEEEAEAEEAEAELENDVEN